jgi:putative SOS response-associated peptidase YedK
MCGRFAVIGPADDLIALFDIDRVGEHLPEPSFNIAPTDTVSIVLDSVPKDAEDDQPVRRLEAARWGLVPAWAKDVGVGTRAFNARIESLVDNNMFKNAVRKRRAIVPATGYYEWRLVDGIKQPEFIHLPDELTVFAGLYEWWRDPSKGDDDPDRWVLSTTIITRDAVGDLGSIHDRMPVFLAPELIDEWLDPHADISAELLGAVAEGGAEMAGRMEHYEVGREVGNVRNNGPELLEPLDQPGQRA